MDSFTQAYIECALWSSSHCDEEGNEICPLDEYDGELAPETIKQMEEDCADFQTSAAHHLNAAYEHETITYGPERAGHDFWLTRNGHGASFWDRGLGEIGKALTDAAKTFGSRDLYVGDDGLIYQS